MFVMLCNHHVLIQEIYQEETFPVNYCLNTTLHRLLNITATVFEWKVKTPDFYKSKKTQKIQINQRIKAHSKYKKSMLS